MPGAGDSVNELLDVLGRAHIDYAMVFSAATTAGAKMGTDRVASPEDEGISTDSGI